MHKTVVTRQNAIRHIMTSEFDGKWGNGSVLVGTECLITRFSSSADVKLSFFILFKRSPFRVNVSHSFLFHRKPGLKREYLLVK